MDTLFAWGECVGIFFNRTPSNGLLDRFRNIAIEAFSAAFLVPSE